MSAPGGMHLSLRGDKESSLSSVRDGLRTSAGVRDRPSIRIGATCRAEVVRNTHYHREPHISVKLRTNDVSWRAPARTPGKSIHDARTIVKVRPVIVGETGERMAESRRSDSPYASLRSFEKPCRLSRGYAGPGTRLAETPRRSSDRHRVGNNRTHEGQS